MTCSLEPFVHRAASSMRTCILTLSDADKTSFDESAINPVAPVSH